MSGTTPTIDSVLAAFDNEAFAAAVAEKLWPHMQALRADVLITATQAAEQLHVHPKTLTRAAAQGRRRGVRCGRMWRFDPATLAIVPTSNNSIAAPPPRPKPGAGHRAAAAIRGRRAR